MSLKLSPSALRVLGCLIEKKMATPEYYPLTLNALVNACNQKTNREPVVSYDEETVLEALDELKAKQISWQSNLSRVPKYEERFIKDHNLNNAAAAVMTLLMLRGPQTVGELRGRSERLHAFENLEQVNACLEKLIQTDFVKMQARQPGRKEVRYQHQLSDTIEDTLPNESISSPTALSLETLLQRITHLENEVENLKTQFKDLQT